MLRFASIAIVAVVVLVACEAASGQILWGLKGGVALSEIRWSDGDADTRTRNGVTAGVYASWPRWSHASLVAEVLYAEKGAEDDLGDLRVSYLSLPVSVRYEVSTGNGFAYVSAGPRGDVKLSSDFDTSLHPELSKDLASAVFGANAAAGYHFSGGFVEAQYAVDLSDAIRNGTIGRNSVVTFFLGIEIGDLLGS